MPAVLGPTPAQSCTSLKQVPFTWDGTSTEMVWKAEWCGLAFESRGDSFRSSSLGPLASDMDLAHPTGIFCSRIVCYSQCQQEHWLWLTALHNTHKHPALRAASSDKRNSTAHSNSYMKSRPLSLNIIYSLKCTTRTSKYSLVKANQKRVRN